MTQPAYQPYQQPMRPMMGAPAQPKPSRGGVTTLVAGLLALVVSGLAVGGSFGAISSHRNAYDIEGDTSVYASETTWWGVSGAGSTTPGPEDGESLLAGLTLVLAATLLVLGAVFAFVAFRSRGAGAVAGTRSLLSAGVGVLAGAAVLQLLAVLEQMTFYNEQELEAGQSLEFSAGLGLWLPLGGLVLGVVAVVLAHVGQRAAAVRVEPNTPRMGFPAPYGYRPQQMPVAERPTDVQPEGDDATTTQRVSGATASGTFAPVTPPPAPLTPATTSAPEAPAQHAAAPSTGETPAPVTPATTAEPEPTTAPPATPNEPAAPAAPASGEAPAPVTPATTSAPAPADAPAKPGDESRSALSDFPAAPPAPEPSADDDRTGK